MTSALRGALQDDQGLWDIAYISLGIVTGLLVLASVNMLALVWAQWGVCMASLPTVERERTAAVLACKPDVLALGQAFGLAAGAFSTALLALAAYMAATRKPQGSSTTTTRVQETITAAAPLSPAKPMPVEVINQDPVPVTETPARRARKGKPLD